MGYALLKPDRQGRITLPAPLKTAQLVSYELKSDGSVLLFPVRAVREYPDMSDLPVAAEPSAELDESLKRSLESKAPGSYSHAAAPRHKKRKR